MRANFVDRLLARVDGALAPIWISELITTDEPPAIADLTRAVSQLVAETDRLHLAWSPRHNDWVPRPRTREDVERAVRAPSAEDPTSLVARLLREPVDLAHELPLRVTLAPLTNRAHGSALLALQIHHAIADARSLMHLNRRLWQLLAGRTTEDARLGPAQMTDRAALDLARKNARAIPALLSPRYRVLAQRGQPLGRRGDHIGAPMLRSIRVHLDERFDAKARSGLFFGALLAGIVAHEEGRRWDLPLRLRVPVDMRRALGIGPTLENACSALAVELRGHEVRARIGDPTALCRLVPDALARLQAQGTHLATIVECMAVSRLATTRALRDHVRPDLLAPRRANTMVTTYVGSLDRYFEEIPFPVRTIRTQTPTWGANGFSFGDALVINATAFEGIWSEHDLDAFATSMGAWIEGRLGLRWEILR